jgi:PAS domain S-box-containing protein
MKVLDTSVATSQSPAGGPLKGGSDAGPTAEPARADILFLGEDAELRAYVEQALASAYRVAPSKEPAEAIRNVLRQPPDLILADVDSLGREGLRFLSALRRDHRTDEISIIALSTEEDQRGEELPRDDLLIKPFSPRELQARVGAHLSMARQRREAVARERFLRAEAETLNAAARELAAELDVPKLLAKAVAAGVKLTGASAGTFAFNLLSDGEESRALHALAGSAPDELRRLGLCRQSPLLGEVFSSPHAVRIDDALVDERIGPPSEEPCDVVVRSLLAAPVASRSGEVLGGLLFVHPAAERFDEHAERLAAGIAAQAAVALDNARLYGEAHRELEQRRRIEAALLESERRYRQLVEGLAAAVYTCDADGSIQLYNEAAVELWGKAPEVGVTKWCGSYRIYSPDGRELPLDQCPMLIALKEGRPAGPAEIVIERPDGGLRHAVVHPEPIFDDARRVVGAVNLLVDVTDRKQAEAELAAAKDHLSLQVRTLTRLHDLAMQLAGPMDLPAALQAITEGLVEVHNADSGLLSLCDPATGCLQIAASVGFDAERLAQAASIVSTAAAGGCGAVLSAHSRAAVHDVETDPRCANFREAARLAGYRAEHSTPILTRGGEILGVLSVQFKDCRAPTLHEELLANLCARHAAEAIEASRSQQALRDSEQRFAMFMQHLPGLAWIKDGEGRYVFVNEAAERAFQRGKEDLYGRRDDQLFPHAAAAQFHDNDHEALDGQGAVKVVETLEQEDGVHHSLVSKFVIPGVSGSHLIGGIAIDVTERVQAEQALRNSEERFRAVTMNAPVAIFIKDLEGRYTLCNPLASQALGRPRGAAGYTDFDLLPREAAESLRQQDLEVISSGRAIESEDIIPTAGGQRYFLAVKFPLRNAVGETVGVGGVAVDVTDRKQAQQALRESERRLLLATQTGKVGVWAWDLDGNRVSWSESLQNILGVQPHDLAAVESFESLVHAEDRARVQQAIRDAVLHDAPLEVEFRARRPDGAYIWLFSNASVIREGGRAVRMLGAALDITERKQGELALRESETRFRTLASHAPVGIFQSTAAGDTVFVNEGWCEMAGLTPDEARGAGWLQAVHPEDRQRVESDWRQALKEGAGSAAEFRFLRPDGVITWLQGNAVPLRDAFGQAIGYIGTVVDITDRKEAEAALRNSERMYRAIGESIDYGIWVCDAEGGNIYLSESFLELVGRTQEECSGFGWCDALHPDDVEQTIAAWKQCIAAGDAWDVEHRFRSMDGEWHPMLARGVPVRNDRDEIIAWVGINLDISQLKEVESELRESEARFRNMADNAPVLIWVHGVGGCQYVNREFLRFVGGSLSDVTGMNWTAYLHPDDAEGYIQSYEETFEQRRPIDAQFRFRRADGEYRWLSAAGAPRFRPDGAFLGYVGCSVDITDIKASEEALREADRRKDDFLAMLGHELRNPLAGIVTGAQVLSMLDLDDEAGEMQAVISRQASYMSRIVDDLLDVSRIARGKLRLRHQYANLRQLLQDTVDDYRKSRALDQCDLRLDLPPCDLWVWADGARLAQAFSNIIHNSYKFSDGPNVIAIELAADSEAALATITIRDRGIGMTAETLSRIFEPFNQADTSLERSRGGLGLGLALTKGLIHLHGGTVAAASEGLGRGAEVTLTLPCVAPPAGRKAPHASPTRAQQRILIIDDRRDAVLPLRRMLQMDGHTVAAAEDGSTGLAEAVEFKPDVILCDIGLPGELNGYDVSRALRAEAATSSAYLVAVTGYGHEEARRLAKEAGFDFHLTKPVSKKQLRDLLSRRPLF